MALGAAACWGAVVVLNKQVLEHMHPIPVNFFVLLVCVVSLVAIGVPLSLLHWWPLGLGLTRSAAGYIAISGPVTWLVAFNAYYFALRSGRVGVVGPLCSTDPLFTALFASVLIGAALGKLTLAGLFVTVLGVVLISRFMDERPQAPVLDAQPDKPPAAQAGGVIALSLLTAAGWGLAPVMIQLAERSTGGATTTMMIFGEALGVVLLLPFVVARRATLYVRPQTRDQRRRVIALLVAAGVLNALFAVLYYVLIAKIGAVLTMLITASAPVFAIAGGALVLRERLGARLAFGAGLTLAGVFLATLQHAQ